MGLDERGLPDCLYCDAAWQAIARVLRLRPRTLQIVRHIADGYDQRTTAKLLRCSVSTVNTLVNRLYKRLGIHNRVELAK